MTIATYRYFTIEADSQPRQGRKTRMYYVVSRRSNNPLGHICWYGPWRQFVFEPYERTIWGGSCLTDLQCALRVVNEHHKQNRQARVQP